MPKNSALGLDSFYPRGILIIYIIKAREKGSACGSPIRVGKLIFNIMISKVDFDAK